MTIKDIVIGAVLIMLLHARVEAQGIWFRLNGPTGYNSPQAMAVSPLNGDVFISSNINSTTRSGIWKSDDDGLTWQEVSTGISNAYARDLKFYQNELFAASDSVVYRLNGNTWQPADSLLPNNTLVLALVVHRDTLLSMISYGNGDSELFYFDPLNQTWQSTGATFSFFVQINKLYSDGQTLWAATGSGVLKASGSINSFVPASTNIPFNASIISIVAKGDTAYCGTTGGSYFTTDGGNLWQPITAPALIQPITAFSLLISGSQVIAGFNNNGIYASPLGQNNWNIFQSGYPSQVVVWQLDRNNTHTFANSSEGFFAAASQGWQLRNGNITRARTSIVFVDSTEIIASPGALSLLQRSTDGGQTWNDFSSGLPSNTVDIYRKAIRVAGVMIMPSLFGMYRSVNNGQNWQSVAGSLIPNREAAVYGNNLIAPGGSQVAFSTDLGLTWNAYSSGIGSPRTVYTVAVRGSAAYAGTNNGVFEMANPGAPWINYSTGLPNNTFVQKLAVYRNNLIIATNNGVYYRRQGDTQWFQGAQGFFFSDLIVLEPLLLAAGSNGVYFSNDEGKSFHLLNSDYTANMGLIESLWADRNFIYAGTSQSSLWKCSWFNRLTSAPGFIFGSNICAGSNASFDLLISDHIPGNNYILQFSDTSGSFFNAINIDTITNIQNSGYYPVNVLVPANTPPGHNYRYQFVSTNPALPTYPSLFPFRISKPVTVGLQPVNQSVCVGESTAFFVGASGDPINYQWQVDILGNGNFINLVNNASYQDVNKPLLQIVNTPVGLNGSRYRCVINNQCGSLTSSTATLSVNSSNALIVTQPNGFSVCDGQSDTVIIAALGPTLSYQWQQSTAGISFTDISNGPLFDGVNNDTLFINGISANLNGTLIRCLVNGCTISDTISLEVNGQAVSSSVPGPFPFCPGGQAGFSISTAGANLSYQWEEDNGSGFTPISNTGIYSGATTSTLILDNIPAGYDNYQYRCILEGLCSIDSSVIGTGILELNPAPQLLLQPADTGICAGNDAGFAVNAAGPLLNYIWEFNGGSGWQAIPPFPPFNGVNTSQLIIDTVVLSLNNYHFRCRIGGCVVSDSASLSVLANPVVTAPNILVCELQTPFTLTSASPAGGIYTGYSIYSGVFEPVAVTAGLYPYSYSYTAGNGCAANANGFIDFRICVGKEENTPEEKSWTIFPNPGKGLIHFRLNEPLTEPALLQVYNLQGQMLMETLFDEGVTKSSFNTENLVEGLYLARLLSGKMLLTQRLIITR